MENEELEKFTQNLENDEEETSDQNTFAGQLIEFLIQGGAYLFHDQDGNAYARVKRENHNEIYMVRGRSFSEYIALVSWNDFAKPVSSAVRENIISIIEAKAKFDGEKHEMHLRTAWHDNVLWYDLGDWRAVKITTDGWEIVNEPPILFKRFTHQKQQVAPVPGASLGSVLKYLNLDMSKYAQLEILLLTYLISVFIPDIPRPILALHGLQGSAKSTLFRIIKSIVDPSTLDVLTYPKNSQELIQMLSHHFLVCFDNLSELNDWQSDELCRACTGQAFSKRQLYTDDSDILYYYKRAIAINGINLVATKPDLLDRSLIFELQPISKESRMDEESFWKNFEAEKPELLGALFTTLSGTLRLIKSGKIVLEKKPRLADYALWCSAAAVALGKTVNDFMNAYSENIERQNIEAIEASAIAQTIVDFMKDKEEVRGISKSLFDQLKEYAGGLGLDRDSDFPKSQRWLWRKIKVVKGNLQSLDIEALYDDKKRPREIILRNNKNTVKNDDNVGNDVKTPKNSPSDQSSMTT